MGKTLTAIYENGVLRPLEPLELEDRQRVQITLSEERGQPKLDDNYLEEVRKRRTGKGPKPSLDEVRTALSGIAGKLSEDIRAQREER